MSAAGDRLAFPAGEDDTDGLTKRELFAAMAMQGALQGQRLELSEDKLGLYCASAVRVADALLAALAEKKP